MLSLSTSNHSYALYSKLLINCNDQIKSSIILLHLHHYFNPFHCTRDSFLIVCPHSTGRRRLKWMKILFKLINRADLLHLSVVFRVVSQVDSLQGAKTAKSDSKRRRLASVRNLYCLLVICFARKLPSFLLARLIVL